MGSDVFSRSMYQINTRVFVSSRSETTSIVYSILQTCIQHVLLTGSLLTLGELTFRTFEFFVRSITLLLSSYTVRPFLLKIEGSGKRK